MATTAPMVDGSKVRLFGSKKAAQHAARCIGWPVGSATPVRTRFQSCWAIGTGVDTDPNTGLPWLSREHFAALYHARNNDNGEALKPALCTADQDLIDLTGRV